MRSIKRSKGSITSNEFAASKPIIISTTQHPGYAHFEAMKPRFMDLKAPRRIVNVDLRKAGRLLIKAAKKWKLWDLGAVLEGVPKHLYDADRAGDLFSYGWALRYIGTMRNRELALTTSAAIPGELVVAAEEMRARLLKTAAHFFGEHPVHGKEIAAIRRGRGHAELIDALIRLVVLHTNEVAILSTDPIHYRAEDVADAQALHLRLSDALDELEGNRWAAVARKAFTFIEREYRDLRLTVAWAWRDDPEVLEAFPTLFTRTRRTRGAAQVTAKAADDAGSGDGTEGPS